MPVLRRMTAMPPKPLPLLRKPAPIPFPKSRVELDRLREALAEDLGAGARDVTTAATIPRGRIANGLLIAKADGVFCGAPAAERVWRSLSRGVRLEWRVAEGADVSPGVVVAEMRGDYAALLIGERVALNVLQRLSGVATATRALVSAAEASARAAGLEPPAICDTRKTTPLWRAFERYAVAAGGGLNHRFGLSDMFLLKENHIRAAGGIAPAIAACRAMRLPLHVTCEATDEREAAEAVAAGADMVLLDNLPPARVKAIVRRHRESGVAFEVSGGVNLRNVAAYARTGVHRISTGSITHSAPALDLSLQLHPEEAKPARERRG